MKNTISPATYWNEKGAYQTEYNKLYQQHVPTSGMAKTLNGELIRAISRLSWDYYNNGNCNALEKNWGEDYESCSYCRGTGEDSDGEECGDCGGEGGYSEEVVTDVYVSKMFALMLDLIEKSITDAKDAVYNVTKVITDDLYSTPNEVQFSDIRQDMYNNLFDIVISHVLATPDSELPKWYVEEMS